MDNQEQEILGWKSSLFYIPRLNNQLPIRGFFYSCSFLASCFHMQNAVYGATKTASLLCCVCDPVLSVCHKSHFLLLRCDWLSPAQKHALCSQLSQRMELLKDPAGGGSPLTWFSQPAPLTRRPLSSARLMGTRLPSTGKPKTAQRGLLQCKALVNQQSCGAAINGFRLFALAVSRG